MLTRFDIEEKLRISKSLLNERYKVNKIGIFGSYVHADETEESDVDILVEFYQPIGWEFVDLKEFLEEVLGKKVDLVTASALKSQIKDEIMREVVYQ